MIAVDTNLLVYAHRADSGWHERAYKVIAGLAEGRDAWAIPWPCIHEFLAIVTHRRIYNPPTPLHMAVDQVDAWLESPHLVLLCELEDYWQESRVLLKSARIAGPQIHDARVMALCKLHGIEELWSADRDFGRFAGTKVRNPLIR